MVALFHVPQNAHFAEKLFDFSAIANAWVFVDLFFVLSGFVMFWSYAGKLNTARDFTRYLLRRFGRLYPLHIATLALFTLVWSSMQSLKWLLIEFKPGVSFAAAPFSGPEINASDFLLNLFLLHGTGFRWTDAFNFPSWSVSLEFWAYWIFAGVCLAARSLRRTFVMLHLIAGLALVWYLVRLFEGSQWIDELLIERNFARIALAFGFGAGVAYLRQSVINTPTGIVAMQWLAALLALTLVVEISSFPSLFFAAPLIFGFLIFVLSFEASAFDRFFRTEPMVWLGQRSYAIYMTHATLLLPVAVLGNIIGPDWQMAIVGLYLSFVLLLADYLHRWIELPCRQRFYRM